MNHVLTAAFVKIAVVTVISAHTDPAGEPHLGCGTAGPAIIVEALGVKDRKGLIKLELYSAPAPNSGSEDLALGRHGKVAGSVAMPMPHNGPVRLCIKVPQPGPYAILLLHKRDAKDRFSVSEDGVGLPMNVRIGRRRPKVQEAVVQVGRGVATLRVQVQYLQGLSGFGMVAR